MVPPRLPEAPEAWDYEMRVEVGALKVKVAEQAAQHSGHERLCTERWEQSRKAQDQNREAMDSVAQTLKSLDAKLDENAKEAREGRARIYSLLWTVFGAGVVVLIGVVGYLLDRQWPSYPGPLSH
jgi:ferric-dicitrate binding protein FerR (iron transport regulator)